MSHENKNCNPPPLKISLGMFLSVAHHNKCGKIEGPCVTPFLQTTAVAHVQLETSYNNVFGQTVTGKM